MSDPTTCDICGSLQCAKTICPILRERFHAQAARLAAVEARLFGVDEHQPWCRVRNGERACNCYSGRPAPPPSAEPTTAPVASGASVPDGYVLGEGWRLAERDWACTPFRGRCLSAGAAYETTTTEDGPMCGVGACPAHAVEMGALVPVEPPKAETAQAAERLREEWRAYAPGRFNCDKCRASVVTVGGEMAFAGPDTPAYICRACARRAGAFVGQPAEPSAPVGSTPCCFELIDRRPGAYCTLRRGHDGRHGTAAEAPPVAAKLSERHRKWVTLYLPLRDKSDGHRYSEEMAVLETALDSTLAENKALRKMLETRDARIAGLEGSHREDVEAKVMEERERCKWWATKAAQYAEGVTPWNGRDAIANGDPVPKVGG